MGKHEIQVWGVYVFVTKTSSLKTQPLHHLLLQMAFWGFCVGKLSDAAADLHADFSNYKFFFRERLQEFFELEKVKSISIVN